MFYLKLNLFLMFLIVGLQSCQSPTDSTQSSLDPINPSSDSPPQSDPQTSNPSSGAASGSTAQPSLPGPSSGSGSSGDLPSIGASPVVSAPTPSPVPPSEPVVRIEVKLSHVEDLRILKNQILEKGIVVPTGTVLSVPAAGESIQAKIRDENGQAVFTSNSYYGLTKIERVPAGSSLTQAQINQLNQTPGGLYVSSRIEGDLPKEVIPALSLKDPGPFYASFYEASGRPKFSFAALLKKTFGSAMNKVIAPESQSSADREKWTKIMNALKAFSDRTRLSEGQLFYMSQKDADIASIKYENTGFVTLGGAYMVAVNSTAVRHGFAGVPCAEFVSEVLRQAYVLAGYRHQEDFSTTKKNPLIWSHTALVENLGHALVKAGWVPWDHHLYRAPIGAVMGNDIADSPGHAYLNAGQNGRWILDNSGGPKGRDIAQMIEKTLRNQYHTGVFFLPPGEIPSQW